MLTEKSILNKEHIILVTGATGTQGNAVANALLKDGNSVRIITRKSSRNSPLAEELEARGAEVFIADMEDPVSVEEALEGVYGLFSVQAMDNGTNSEIRHADTLISAALKKGIQHVVHASVNQTGNHESFPGWHEKRWNQKYWLDKAYAEALVKNAGFKHWTILRPVFFMDNFIPPKVSFMFPDLVNGEISSAWKSTAKLQLIDVEDTGTFASAAFNDLKKFDKRIVDIAGDELTINNIGQKITTLTGKYISVNNLSETGVVKKGTPPGFANAQEWNNYIGYNVDINGLHSYGLPLTTFEQYLNKNKDSFPA